MKKMVILLLLFTLLGCTNIEQNVKMGEIEWEHRLYTPTQITKIENEYFIVDCWQHRIIYSDDVTRPIKEWNTLDDKLGGPHSIATDGELLVVDNTGFNKVNVYAKGEDGDFYLHQEIEDIGIRPHRVIYSAKTDSFYVLGSVSTDMYVFKNVEGKLELELVKELKFLEGRYTRSFQIIEDKMYFVSGPNKIVIANYLDNSFEIFDEYDVPEELAGMNDIFKIEDYYYITSTPQRFVRVRNLNDLRNSVYEDLYEQLGLKGTPYYFEKIGDYIYLPEITEYSSILRFKVKDNEIHFFERLHDFGLPTGESIKRKSEYPQ